MKPGTPNIRSEDVLNAFAVEPQHDRPTLERYLRKFPQFALELAELSHELSTGSEERTDLTVAEVTAINEAWMQYSRSTGAAAARIFENLSVPQLRELAAFLDVPRQILTAFRERKVVVSSIPQPFLARLAGRLNASVGDLKLALIATSDVAYVRSHKADEKPISRGPVTFEQLLIDAQVPSEKRARLMA